MKTLLWSAGACALTAAAVTLAAASAGAASSRLPPAPPPMEREIHFVHVEIPIQPLATYAFVADAVVVARIDEWREDYPADRVAETVYQATVVERWKGEPAEHIEIRVAGALYGNAIVRVPAAPRFEIGDRAALFLSRDPASGAYWILGLGGGTYQLSGDESLRVHGLHARGMPLDAFESQVRDHVRAAGVPAGH